MCSTIVIPLNTLENFTVIMKYAHIYNKQRQSGKSSSEISCREAWRKAGQPAFSRLFPLCPVSFTVIIATGSQNLFRLPFAVIPLDALPAAEDLASIHHIPFVHQFAALVA